MAWTSSEEEEEEDDDADEDDDNEASHTDQRKSFRLTDGQTSIPGIQSHCRSCNIYRS